jgi:hypothetical protein
VSTCYRGLCLPCRTSRVLVTRFAGTTRASKGTEHPTCWTLGIASGDEDEAGAFIEEHQGDGHDLRLLHEDAEDDLLEEALDKVNEAATRYLNAVAREPR